MNNTAPVLAMETVHHEQTSNSMQVSTEILEREVELDDGRTLYVADNPVAADNEAGSTVWDAGLVLAHYLIKQHEIGEVGASTLPYFASH